MRIALVTDWYEPRIGGIELHLRDLAVRLTNAGHEVTVVTPTPGRDDVDGIRVVRVQAPRSPLFEFLYTPAGIRAIGHALAELRADVVHAHVSIISPAAIGAVTQATRLGVPSVVTFHSIVPQTRLLAGAARVALRTGRWTTSFTAVSARVGRDVAPMAAGHPIDLLPNGIDFDRWPRTTEPVGARIELLGVMRLNAKKRPHVLLRMMRELQRTKGVPPVQLRIVGDGPLRASLERDIQRLRLGGVVELLGHQPRERIRALLGETHIFVLPTVRESFGLAALEASCSGVPVVAMAQSGVAEFIDGRSGLLARSDAELFAHVTALARDADRRKAMRVADRTSLSRFDWRAVVPAHVAAYRDAIARRPNV